MKAFIITTLLTISFFSPTKHPIDTYLNHKASQDLASQMVRVLQQNSPDEFVELAPRVDDFKNIIAQNEDVYGSYVAEAQKDFITTYLQHTLPRIKESFELLVEDGKRRGIDWNNVTLISWETLDLVAAPFATAPFIVAIESGGKIYRIEIAKALYINDHWCVSQYIKLI